MSHFKGYQCKISERNLLHPASKPSDSDSPDLFHQYSFRGEVYDSFFFLEAFRNLNTRWKFGYNYGVNSKFPNTRFTIEMVIKQETYRKVLTFSFFFSQNISHTLPNLLKKFEFFLWLTLKFKHCCYTTGQMLHTPPLWHSMQVQSPTERPDFDPNLLPWPFKLSSLRQHTYS